MDYSKVNNALNGWVGSGARRDRAKAELGEAMQLMQAQQQMQQQEQAKTQEMDNWMAHIHGMASQVAVRNEDREKIQAMYDQEKSVFLDALEKSGNDPVKFMNSGGRKIMQNFYNNIAFSEDASRIKNNTTQVQSFYEQLEGNDGKEAHLIPLQVRRDFDNFMDGNIDSFEHRQLAPWSEVTDDSMGDNLAQRYLNTENNRMIFSQNYLNEYNLDATNFDNIDPQQLERYVAQYVGGNPQQALQPTPTSGGGITKTFAGKVTQQHRRLNMRPVSTSVIGSNSQEYMNALRDYDSGGFEYGVTPENTDVYAHRGFVGDELIMAQAVHGKEAISDLEDYVPVQARGSWFTEDGDSIIAGEDLGDLRPGAIFMGYKVKQQDGTYKLVKAEDLEGSPKDAEHALIQEYESDDVLWFSSNYYNEIDTQDSRTMSTFSKLKGLDTTQEKYSLDAGFQQQEPAPIKTITMESTQEDLASQLPNYESPMIPVMKQLGLKDKNNVAKSILLSLATAEGDIDRGIGSLVERFNPTDFPDLNQALVEGNSKKFFDMYYDLLTKNGVDSQAAEQYLMQVDSLRDRMQKAQR